MDIKNIVTTERYPITKQASKGSFIFFRGPNTSWGQRGDLLKNILLNGATTKETSRSEVGGGEAKNHKSTIYELYVE